MELVGGKGVKIGKPRRFKIVPNSPGLVYASVTDCSVRSEDGLVYKLAETDRDSINMETKHICTDSITNFTKDDEFWSTTNDLEFEFTAFRWSTEKISQVGTYLLVSF